MANLYPAIGMSYRKKCKRHHKKEYDKELITLVFIFACGMVFFFNDWTLRFQMWGSLLLLYLALMM